MSNIYEKIDRLKRRRSGSDRKDAISLEAYNEILAKSFQKEKWENRAEGKPYTQYVIGAMQEVDQNSTRISIETARRVESQLENRLSKVGIITNFKLQGSVPLNVHIQGVSDVDIVACDASFLIYDSGRKSQSDEYFSTTKTSLGVLSNLRRESEIALRNAFPAATITAGDKAINLKGASLQRPVDVVPAHWWDTTEYQERLDENERGIFILSTRTSKTISNLPFLHIKRIIDRCDVTFGGVRKAIRLCKNVKADYEESGREIALSSYDIASIMYHADQTALQLGMIYELAILSETQRYLDFLTLNEEYAKNLIVPNGTRRIFDEPEKFTGLRRLSIKFDELIKLVAEENTSPYASRKADTLENSRDIVKMVLV